MSTPKYTVRWVASCVYRPNMSVTPHSHDFYQYLYVKSGSGCMQAGDEKFPLEAGKIYVLPPHVQHHIQSSADGMTTCELKFHTNGDAVPRFSMIIDLADSHAELIFEEMFNEVTHMHVGYEEMLSVKLEELHLWMLRLSTRADVQDKPLSYSQTFSNVIFYMERHLAEEVSLKTLSDIAHMEKIYFLKKFKSEVGTTPVNYLRRLRINQSKKLLINSEFNITQIACTVGFQSVHHFSNVFKKLVGMSPSEYKKQKDEA